MDEWREATLGELAEVYDGPHATPHKTETGPWFLSISSLDRGRLNLNESAHLSEADFGTWTRRVTPQAGDVLFSYETRLGEAAPMPTDVRACLGRRMGLMRPKDGCVDSRFLLYAYLGPQFQRIIQERRIHGATVDRIPISELPSWPMMVPSLRDQQAISALLGALDDKFVADDSVEQTTFDLLQQTWLASVSGTSVRAIFADVATIQKGLSYKGAHLGRGDPLINLGNFNVRGRFKADQTKFYGGESRARHWLENGDLVLANTDLTQRREVLGQPAIVSLDTDKALFSHHVFAVRLLEGFESDKLWLYCALRDSRFRDRAVTFASGTTVASLPADAVLQYEIPWARRDWRRHWSAKADALIRAAHKMRAQREALADLRDALLPKLMWGELRIQDAERVVEEAT